MTYTGMEMALITAAMGFAFGAIFHGFRLVSFEYGDHDNYVEEPSTYSLFEDYKKGRVGGLVGWVMRLYFGEVTPQQRDKNGRFKRGG